MIAQLRTVLLLTQSEIQVARIRVGQARTDAVRRELTENARNAEKRAADITAELQRIGGVADALSPLVGRVGAFVKGAVEQAQPVEEALLGDLALEHQLRDRAVYLRALAEAAHDPKLRDLADRLVTAHTATVDWLATVLAEDALGGPAALRPTPLQAAAGGLTKVANLPIRFARHQVDRIVASAQRSGEQVRDSVSETTEAAVRLGEDTRDVVVTGRDAALDRAEQVARRDGAGDTAGSLHDTRTRLGVLRESELPVGGYDTLTVHDAVTAIKAIDQVEDLNKILHYEEANKNRQGVVSAAQTRYAGLVQDITGTR